MATAIFVLVQIAVCKCHPKFTPGMQASVEVDEEYEPMDGGEAGGLALNDPTYMEIGAAAALEMKENDAYII